MEAVISAVLVQQFGISFRIITQTSSLSLDVCRRALKTFVFARY